MAIIVRLDVAMAMQKMKLQELSERVGISMTNLSLLKNGRVKGVKFETLDRLCEVLECQPGDILEHHKE